MEQRTSGQDSSGEYRVGGCRQHDLVLVPPDWNLCVGSHAGGRRSRRVSIILIMTAFIHHDLWDACMLEYGISGLDTKLRFVGK